MRPGPKRPRKRYGPRVSGRHENLASMRPGPKRPRKRYISGLICPECGASMRPGPKRPRKRRKQPHCGGCIASFNEAGAEKAPETQGAPNFSTN